MPALTRCPRRETWIHLMSGELATREVAPLADHLETCAACAEALATLPDSDALVASLRVPAGAEMDAELPAWLPPLMARIKAMRRMATTTTCCSAQAESYADDNSAGSDTNLSFLSPAQGEGEIGRLGDYRILRILGQGGMGLVFEAEDVKLRRKVALKVMLPRIAANPLAKNRFLREARVAAAIEHDHVVPIYHVDETGGVPFLAMPLLRGESLEQRLSRRGRAGVVAGTAINRSSVSPSESSPELTLSEALRITREAAQGLAAAHEHGLVHRDIKPANLWLETRSGATGTRRVKILDFGLARSTDVQQEHLTQSGAILGTPAYMAPEQAGGAAVDTRADLFSLGAILYEMLTGVRPFEGPSTIAILSKLALETPPAPHVLLPIVPEPLSALVMRLLAKDPNARLASATTVLQELERIERDLVEQPSEATITATAGPTVVTSQPANPPTSVVTSAPQGVVLRPTTKPASPKNRAGVPAGRRPLPPWISLALAVGLAGVVLLGVTIYRLQTDQGILVVEIDEQDAETIEAKLKQGGLEVKDATTGRVFKIQGHTVQTERSGTYKLPDGQGLTLIVEDADGLRVLTNEFKLSRGERTRIRVTLSRNEQIAATLSTTPAPTTSAPRTNDRRAVEWALSHGGGDINVRQNGTQFKPKTLAELPQGELELIGVILNDAVMPGLNDESLSVFQGCRHLSTLGILGKGVRGPGLINFEHCAGLTYLALQATSVTDESLATFQVCSRLTVLNLSATNVTGEGLVHFKDCQGLGTLNLSTSPITDAGLAHVKNCRRIAHLDLGNTKIGDPGLEHIRGMTKLESLQLFATHVGDRGMECVKELTQLQYLGLERTNVTDAGLAQLSDLPNLTHLVLDSNTITDAGLAHLSRLFGLAELHLEATQVTREGVEKLHAALPKCKIVWDGGTVEPVK